MRPRLACALITAWGLIPGTARADDPKATTQGEDSFERRLVQRVAAERDQVIIDSQPQEEEIEDFADPAALAAEEGASDEGEAKEAANG